MTLHFKRVIVYARKSAQRRYTAERCEFYFNDTNLHSNEDNNNVVVVVVLCHLQLLNLYEWMKVLDFFSINFIYFMFIVYEALCWSASDHDPV